MIKSNTVERAADVSDAAGSGAGLNTSFRGGMRTLAVALGTTVLSAVTAEGSIVRDPFTIWDPIARANFVDYSPGHRVGGGSVALRIFDGISGTRNTSAGFMGNYLNPATNQVQPLFITAYHNYADFIGAPQITMTVRTGTNYNSSPGQMISISSFELYTNSGSRDWTRPDAMWLWGNAPVDGSNAVVGNASGNLAFASFSRPASEQTGLLPADGFGRTVFSPYDASGSVPSGFDSSIYSQAICRPENSLAGLGRESISGSGGLVYTQLISMPDGTFTGGEPVGMTVAGTNGTSLSGSSIFLDFNTEHFRAEYDRVRNIPSPGFITLLLVAVAGVGSKRSRQNSVRTISKDANSLGSSDFQTNTRP